MRYDNKREIQFNVSASSAVFEACKNPLAAIFVFDKQMTQKRVFCLFYHIYFTFTEKCVDLMFTIIRHGIFFPIFAQ